MLFVLTGPESSGKSTLAEALAGHFQRQWIAEAAREMLTAAVYEATDLLQIAEAQQRAEQPHAGDLTFADTDLQTIYIWWQERFGPAPSSLVQAYARQSRRFYLLCQPDLPWQPDPLRQNPHDRGRLFDLYERDLRTRGLPYEIVSGAGSPRIEQAIATVKRVLAAQP